LGGTNNYAVDDMNFVNPPPGTDANTILPRVTAASPSGSIQSFAVPKTWPDNTAADSVSLSFVDWLISGSGVQYEIAMSTCPGDFQYYTTQTASNADLHTTPCGVTGTPFGTINWSTNGSFLACRISAATADKTWYVNWRIVPGTGSSCANITVSGSTYHTCGQPFGSSHF
jgi:hypothetical protein